LWIINAVERGNKSIKNRTLPKGNVAKNFEESEI
jgi:hypothetical protein